MSTKSVRTLRTVLANLAKQSDDYLLLNAASKETPRIVKNSAIYLLTKRGYSEGEILIRTINIRISEYMR